MQRRASWLVVVLALVGLAVAGVVAATTSGRSRSRARSQRGLRAAWPAGTVASFGGGAWSWFQDPRAVQVGGRVGRTYAGWIARNGDSRCIKAFCSAHNQRMNIAGAGPRHESGF